MLLVKSFESLTLNSIFKMSIKTIKQDLKVFVDLLEEQGLADTPLVPDWIYTWREVYDYYIQATNKSVNNTLLSQLATRIYFDKDRVEGKIKDYLNYIEDQIPKYRQNEYSKYSSLSDKFSFPKDPYVTAWVSTYMETYREPDPDDEWDAGEDGEVLSGFGVLFGKDNHKISSSHSECMGEAFLGFMPKKGDTVFLIIERYGSGSTFGSTNPVFRPCKIFKTYEDSENWTKSEEGERFKDTDYFGGHQEYLIEMVTVE